MRVLLALLAFAVSAAAQVVGAPFGTGAAMFQYSYNKGPGGFLNSYAIVHNSTAAFCAQGLASMAPVPLPFDPAAGNVYLDIRALVGIEPMTSISQPGVDWGYLRNLPNGPTLVGLTVYTQCLVVVDDGTGPRWKLTHAWATTLG